MRPFTWILSVLAILSGFASDALHADDAIERLIVEASLREGATAMRDVSGWDPSRKIIVRDLGFDSGDLVDRFPDADIVIVTTFEEAGVHASEAGAIIGFCDDDLLARGPRVTWVQIYSAGAERCLAVDRATRKGTILTNMQKMSSPAIAEHAIAMLLALARNLPAFTADMESGAWKRQAAYTDGMTTVAGKTMLVIGLGGIGTEIARRAAALGMRVVGTRNSSREGPDFVDYVGLSDEMTDLAHKADVIVNALPLTEQTRGLLDKAFFEAGTARRPYFINVGRGATVDTEALLEALQSGRLAGAGLDVTDPEPLPPGHALWQQQNLIITPHVSARGSDRQRHKLVVGENIRRYLEGEPLLNVVDPGKGY